MWFSFFITWEQRKVNSICEKTYGGGTPNTSDREFWSGETPWIQSSDIVEHNVLDVTVRKRISDKAICSSATQRVPANSIAIITRVGVGKLAFMPFPYTTSQDFLSLSGLRVNALFATYALYVKLQNDMNIVQGTSIKGITKEELLEKEIAVPICPLEQERICTLFKGLDNLITLHQRKQNWQNLRFLRKISSLILAIAWEQRKAYNVADYSKGCGYSKSDLKEFGTPIILYGRLYTKYQFIISEVDTFVVPKSGSYYSQGNEVIIPASGETAEDIARASAVGISGVLLGGDLNILHPYDFINPAFLALAISNGVAQRELAKKAQGKSVVHIHNSDIQEVPIAYPLRIEQEQIVGLFRNLDNLITLHQCEEILIHNEYGSSSLSRLQYMLGNSVRLENCSKKGM